MAVTSAVLAKWWVGVLRCQTHSPRVSSTGTCELYHGGEIEPNTIKCDTIKGITRTGEIDIQVLMSIRSFTSPGDSKTTHSLY